MISYLYKKLHGNNWMGRKHFVSELKCIDSSICSHRVRRLLPPTGYWMEWSGFAFLVLPDHLELHYGQGASKGVFRIEFLTTKANYGNKRYWLQCPIPDCGRRCGKLYIQHSTCGIPVAACRLCYNLAYSGQNKDVLNRLIDKKWKLIRRLKADSSVILPHDRPKGMHRKTFDRIRNKIDELEEEIERGIDRMASKLK